MIASSVHTTECPTQPELALVVPVYNEEDAIVGVLSEWRQELEKTVGLGKFIMIVIDDGSSDETPVRLSQIGWPELIVRRHSNRGHGQSCIAGYLAAEELGATYVFQIDSDGQCDPAFFASLWEHRGRVPALYGRRTQRDDGQARALISSILRWSLKLAHRTSLNDTNVPYRLYQTARVAQAARQIPKDFALANIAIALLLEPEGFEEQPIRFRDRQGGHPSVRWWGFAPKALKLHRDLFKLDR